MSGPQARSHEATTRTFGERVRALPGLLARAPWWLALLVGLACIGVGLTLATRPLSSLGALITYVGLSFILSGLAELLENSTTASQPGRTILGGGSVAVGLVVLLWAGGTMAVLPVFIACALLASGIARAVNVIRGTDGDRISSLMLALADVLLGVVALAWPDVTLLIVAVLFGARTMLFGLGTSWNAVARRRKKAGQPSTVRRSLRIIGAVASLALALAAAGLGTQLRQGSPALDAFYDVPPSVPAEPGKLLKSEPFTTKVPAGAKAWRILYTTTRAGGEPAVASGIVLTSLASAAGPRPVITWAHGTTGYSPNCAPSNLGEPFSSGGMPALDQVVENGWVLVATDYVGLGTPGPQPYLIGDGEARSVLDAVRAAKELDTQQETLTMADSTVIWGHSQGGQAALWTGGLAPSYAPELKIAGVAAMAPASDAIGLVANMPNIAGGSVFASYVAAAYADTYPDVNFNDYVIPTARTFVREMSTRCLSEPGVLVSLISAIAIDKDKTIFAKDPTQGTLGNRLRENTPLLPIPVPLLLAQGETDNLVIPSVQDSYVAGRCAAGQKVDYRKYADKDHMGLVGDDSPLIADLIAWTQDRIHGLAATPNC